MIKNIDIRPKKAEEKTDSEVEAPKGKEEVAPQEDAADRV